MTNDIDAVLAEVERMAAKAPLPQDETDWLTDTAAPLLAAEVRRLREGIADVRRIATADPTMSDHYSAALIALGDIEAKCSALLEPQRERSEGA